jgi:hypothetical protein
MREKSGPRIAHLYLPTLLAAEQSGLGGRSAAPNILAMRLLWLLLAPFSLSAQGEVYSWKEAGSTRITNEPPAWYRIEAAVRGPRTLVMAQGRIIDDTALPMAGRRRLRPLLYPAMEKRHAATPARN